MKQRIRKLMRSRPVLLITCLILALSLVPVSPGSAARAIPSDAEKPTVTVNAIAVDDYVELGLSVQDGEKPADFRSVGAVLTYDPALLAPVDWEEEVGEIEVTGADWANTTSLSTKGPDSLSGKTALTYIENNTGYLYLSAEAPLKTSVADLAQAYPTQPGENEGDPATDLVAATSNDLTARGFDAEYAPDGGATLPKVEQAVVVRFKLNGTLSDALASIALVQDGDSSTVAFDSPIHDKTGVALFTGNDADYNYDVADQEGFPVHTALLTAEKGTTYFQGGSGGGITDGVALMLFDWDSEPIGSITVARSPDVAAMTANLTAALESAKTKFKTADGTSVFESHGGYLFEDCWIPYESETPTSYGTRMRSDNAVVRADPTETTDAARELGRPDDDVLTAVNESGVNALAKQIVDDYDDKTIESISLKAAYYWDNDYSDAHVLSGGYDFWNTDPGGISGRGYTIKPIKYNHYGYGTDGSVSITLRVEREKDNVYVPRPAEPALKVYMMMNTALGQSAVYSLIRLSGADVEEVEVVPDSPTPDFGEGVTDVYVELIDTYGVSSWPSASDRWMADVITYRKGDPVDYPVGWSTQIMVEEDGAYFAKCFLGGINSACEQCYINHGGSDAADFDIYSDASITVIDEFTLGSIGIDFDWVDYEAIYTAWKTKYERGDSPADETTGLLSRREIAEALGTVSRSYNMGS